MIKSTAKTFFISTTLLAVSTLLYAHIVSAQAIEYVPLAPITSAPGASITPSSYIAELFKIGIGIAAALAVLAIAFNGIRYMMSDVVTNKSESIKGIKNALLGLLLALASFLVLNTINPDLTGQNSLGELGELGNVDIVQDPTPGSTATAYRLTYYDSRFILRWQQYEYELNYVSVTGSGTVRKRYPTKDECQIAGDALVGGTDNLSSSGWACFKVLPYTDDPAYGQPLSQTTAYTTQAQEEFYATTNEICQNHYQTYLSNSDIFSIMNLCGEGAALPGYTYTYPLHSDCMLIAQQQQEAGALIKSSDLCVPVTTVQ